MSGTDINAARELLTAAGVFFGCHGDDDPQWAQTINLNDACYWACSDAQYVEDAELPRLAELFFRYGYPGVLYWVTVEKRGGEVPEFLHVRRQIEFVTQEEAIVREVPVLSQRAYFRKEYTIGKD